MILDSIELTNYKSYFGTHTFSFDKINLIVGANYIGKSTICNAIKFCLYGDTGKKVSLSDLPTRGLATSCSVTTNWTIGVDKYSITREVPTKTTMLRNGSKVNTGTSSQIQPYINDLFGTSELFKKFRMIDTREGINILEGSELELKKTLFANEDESLSKARTQLLNKINEIEKYLTSQKTVSIHYPSTIRKSYLESRLALVNKEEYTLNTELKQFHNIENEYSSSIRKYNDIIFTNNSKTASVNHSKKCPECKQDIKVTISDELLKGYAQATLEAKESLGGCKTGLIVTQEYVRAAERALDEKSKLKTRINNLLYKLSLSFKRDAIAKYTEKDLVLAKAALSKFDEFGSYYIKRQLEYIEPIINEIASIVDIQVRFVLNEKGKLDIEMVQNGTAYSYEDISEAQKLTIGVAFKLAVLIRDGKRGLVISDEGCSCLDNNNLRKIFDMFSNTEFQLVSVVHRADDLDNVNVIDLNQIRKSSI